MFAAAPVPVPHDYFQGIDIQKADLESVEWASYLRGEWRVGSGWWYYYLYALAIKTPIGLWLIAALAAASAIASRGFRAACPDEVCLLLPPVAVLTLVSSQTAFTIHTRYVIPALPFVFVSASRAAKCIGPGAKVSAGIVLCAVAWMVCSSLRCYPHCLSYFNEFAGGPGQGRFHLVDSNIGCGQDLLFLKEWLDSHPEAHPVGLASFGWVDPRLAGIDFQLPPAGPNFPVRQPAPAADDIRAAARVVRYRRELLTREPGPFFRTGWKPEQAPH